MGHVNQCCGFRASVLAIRNSPLAQIANSLKPVLSVAEWIASLLTRK